MRPNLDARSAALFLTTPVRTAWRVLSSHALKTRDIRRYVLALLVCVAVASSSHAHEVTYVSDRDGNDANNCTVKAPCLTFNKAISVTLAGGTIFAQGSGAYPAFTIKKSIAIVAGDFAQIDASSSDGIDIEAGSADIVSLRGLTIKGPGPGYPHGGIIVSSVGELHVEKCVISDFVHGYGILMPAGELFVTDSLLRDDNTGIFLESGSATIERSQVYVSKFPISVTGGVVTVRDSVTADGVNGFLADGSSTNMTLEHCLASGNLVSGVSATGGATIRMANSTITANGTGLLNDGSSNIRSFGDNNIDGNTSDGLSAITVTVSKH